ncbi:MAG: hypothetical protein JRJ84_08680 [Deltaproteobacteria bacterium]|nr:hypothetical protein [Deltaproteobacteria bacterium]
MTRTWEEDLGETITIEGVVLREKVGAVLNTERGDIYLDGDDRWADEVSGERVRVTGTVISRHDLPVFEYQDGDPIRAGMPVPEGADVESARQRYLLSDVRWERVETE